MADDDPTDNDHIERQADAEGAPGDTVVDERYLHEARTIRPEAVGPQFSRTMVGGRSVETAAFDPAPPRRSPETVAFESPEPARAAGLPLEDLTAASDPKASISALRMYQDGVMTTVSGDRVDPGRARSSQKVDLPYASGDVLRRIGPYDVLAELGRGAMGIVYKAYSLRLCRPCAIKVMIAGEHATEVQLVRFQNEALLAARLSHPYIVQVFDAGEQDGEFYFVMEFVDGRPLTDLVDAEDEASFRAAVRAIAEAARALHHAHQHGIVHRDIKPDNILVDPDGHPHITDFGIAANVETDARMTAQGALMGTPSYMSPEQANGEVAKLGPATDVHALGATLYHACCGRPPFDGESSLVVLIQVLNDEPPPPSAVAKKLRPGREIDADLDTICLKSLEKLARDRYPSALALAEDLDAWLEDRPIAARPVGTAERLRKLMRRNRAAFIGGLVVFATLVVVGASFGAVTVFNMERTSESLRHQDRQAGLQQAATLERAIRANMLQGRADVVRELVQSLREDPTISGVEVLRTDRTPAYTDLATRKDVEKRLSDEAVIAKIREEQPEMLPKVAEVKRTAFENIDARKQLAPAPFEYDRVAWKTLLARGEPETRVETVDGEPMLTVLKPIENSEACQVCHGEAEGGQYGDNKIRAVLLVRRSQKDVEERIEANQATTRLVGLGTAGAILALVWLFARLFGIRLRRRRYAG